MGVQTPTPLILSLPFISYLEFTSIRDEVITGTMWYRKSWWQGKQKTKDDAAFGPDGSRVWDAKECRTLVYILHMHNHFALLVSHTNERTKIAGNSTIARRATIIIRTFAIVSLWLTQRFRDYRWGEPWVWMNVTKTDILY
ncbi:hypothetical protein AAC387_Pa02g2742 [Persea americana]